MAKKLQTKSLWSSLPTFLLLATTAQAAWFDMKDRQCKIVSKKDMTIDYKGCTIWRFVAYDKVSNKIYDADGTVCDLKGIKRFGDRLSVTTNCGDYMLQLD